MKKEKNENGLIGRFQIGDEELSGLLTLAGAESNLYVYSSKYFPIHNIPDRCIKGILHDLRRMTLIDCNIPPAPSSLSTHNGEHITDADIYPHFVVEGDRHINPKEKCIAEIFFEIDDAPTLFYDALAFSTVIEPEKLIADVASANSKYMEKEYQHLQPVVVGKNPIIQYFAGKTEIISVNTVLGKIEVTHSPAHNMGSPRGVAIKNTIFTTISAEEPMDFHDAISRVYSVARYFGFLVGRPQNIENVLIGTHEQSDHDTYLQVHWSMPPKRDASKGARKPHPSEALINGGMDPPLFAPVLAKYLEREEKWKSARSRFFDCFAEQSYFSIDRLVAAANMFDLIPSDAVPKTNPLGQELKEARDIARKAFKKVPQCAERESALRELKRLGKATLRTKILHRAHLLPNVLLKKLPELGLVISEAVRCRNYYVHGGCPVFDYEKALGTTHFFTNTLEFVFGASDMIDAGWDADHWRQYGSTMSHPFGAYLVNYDLNLAELKKWLPQAH